MATLAVGTLAALSLWGGCGRKDRATPEQLRAQIAALEAERQVLRGRFNDLVANDPRIQGMPDTPVRVGVPTTLVRGLVQRVLAGVLDQVTLDLRNIKVRKSGTVKKVVTIGQYDLNVVIDHVTGKLKTGAPRVTFGGNKVSLALPVSVASGTGSATIDFKWDGRNVSGAVCGDMAVTRVVTGSVRPDRYPVSGALVLKATAEEILAEPRFPVLRVNLKIDPSAESWGAVQRILDEKDGVCGYVVHKVDILAVVRRLIEKGFSVRLPTEKLKPMAVPISVQPVMQVRGQPVVLAINVGQLAITEHVIWLGARVSVASGEPVAARKDGGPRR